MGAFFLYNKHNQIDHKAVEQIFLKKGFTDSPKQILLGKWHLLLYRKQLIETLNYIEDDSGSVYATGTVVYKGLDYTDSLKDILNDFKTGAISKEQLLGNFCLILWDGVCITFLTDSLNIQHLFIDRKRSRISTSFLALLGSYTRKLKINKLAFYEKLATGYILSPDTLVDDIQQVSEKLKEDLNSECPELRWTKGWKNETLNDSFHNKGFKNSIERQIEVFKSYYERVDNLHRSYRGELGLSSGYDSRLVLALGGSFLSTPLAIHTHSTVGVHDFEKRIAEEIARLKKLEIHAVDTLHIEKHTPESLHNILLDGLYFYDARCSFDMGAYSETYTGSYKKRVLGENRLSFNGLGGEIFRNSFITARKHFNTRDWMQYHLYYYYAEEAINNPDTFSQIHSNIISKISERLQKDIRQSMSFFDMRRYFSEIRMPDCDAINHNAQNQISFYLTPFIEPVVIREALKATPYIGTHGKYQAELIRALDPSIASIQSHYGFSFNQIPVTHSIISALKGYTPDRIKNLRHSYLKRRRQQVQQSDAAIEARCDYIHNIEEGFNVSFPDFNWETASGSFVQKSTSIFLASFLNEFSNKLSL